MVTVSVQTAVRWVEQHKRGSKIITNYFWRTIREKLIAELAMVIAGAIYSVGLVQFGTGSGVIATIGWVPETPYWLLANGKDHAALLVLRRLCGPQEVVLEWSTLQVAVQVGWYTIVYVDCLKTDLMKRINKYLHLFQSLLAHSLNCCNCCKKSGALRKSHNGCVFQNNLRKCVDIKHNGQISITCWCRTFINITRLFSTLGSYRIGISHRLAGQTAAVVILICWNNHL